jgi:hypothetical protein
MTRTVTFSEDEFLDLWTLVESIMAGELTLEVTNVLKASRIALAVNRSNRDWIPYELGRKTLWAETILEKAERSTS